MNDLREKLSRMTVANGASLNEEKIAQEKMAKYTSFIKKEKVARSPQVSTGEMPLEEQYFLKHWYELKAANRKKWKVE